MCNNGVVFPFVRSAFTQVLDLGSRGVRALEGILKSIFVLVSTIEGALEKSKLDSPLTDRVEDLTRTIRVLSSVQQDHAPAIDRLDELERSRIHFEAACEGLLLKAEGKHNAAKAAEARERQLKRSYEKAVVDPFPLDGEEAENGAVLALDAQAGEAERVPAVYMGVAKNHKKALALRAKWGTG